MLRTVALGAWRLLLVLRPVMLHVLQSLLRLRTTALGGWRLLLVLLPATLHGLRLLLLLRTASLNLWLLSSGTLLHPRLPLFSQFLFLPILLLTLLLPIAARYSLTGRR